jgi:hypothetical protein
MRGDGGALAPARDRRRVAVQKRCAHATRPRPTGQDRRVYRVGVGRAIRFGQAWYTVTGAARGSRPPFAEGNEAAVKHGGTSPKRWRPIAEHLAAEVVTDAPWLTRPAFRHSVDAWAACEAQSQLVDAWIDEVGPLTAKGGPRAAMALSDRLHARAASLRARLGLDPQSMSKLLATFAGVPGSEDALAALRAEGRALVEARATLPASGRGKAS